ncbi:MAG: hypothetical protein LBJ18_00815 [Rickettsiales bacterium]|jgi:hypothetical protein|nr:hypothetical protein [Rickettsiales bacterium]
MQTQLKEQDKAKLDQLMAKNASAMSVMNSAANLNYYEKFIEQYDILSKNVAEMRKVLGLQQQNRFVLACKILFGKEI